MNGKRAKSALATCPKIGLLWRTDVPASPADAHSARQWPIMAALRELGGEVEAIGYADETAGTARDRLLTCDGVMVWADPISDAGDRSRLDPILHEAAGAGVSISAHPDVIAKMGVKNVLHSTRALGWGTDTHRYADLEELRALLPERLASGARVLKENRSNGGRGVWRVEVVDRGRGAQPNVSVLHAARGSVPLEMPLDALIDRFAPYFERGECLIDQPFQPRLGDGMIRCYVSADKVVGFGHQLIRALLPPPSEGIDSPEAQPGPRVMHPADAGAFQSLRDNMEQSWIPGLQHILAVERDELPLLWDADFLYGPKDDRGSDSYVLCEINVSSVAPFPPSAVRTVALRDDRGLHFRRPVPPLACTGENLEPLNLAGASIVTWHRHSTSVLHPDQEAQTHGYTLRPQGGAAAPLTEEPPLRRHKRSRVPGHASRSLD